MENDEIRELKQALKESPENMPLRKMLVRALMKAGRWAEAEPEIKEALRSRGSDKGLRVMLAETFLELGKVSEGLVLMEDMHASAELNPAALIIYTRLLLKNGQHDEASEQYEAAVGFDPELEDAYLESAINEGLGKGPEKIRLTASGEADDDDYRSIEIERPTIDFSSVGGMDDIKKEIGMKIIHPLKFPELYKAYGKSIGGGILLYGPPGCGKTHLARATAGEVNAAFISVGINEILDMYIGQSERNLHAIFEQARQSKPAVLFFDEVDALGASRSDMRHSAGRQLINQFLAELDGIEFSNEGVLVLAATNAPWHLDPAFRRPGRFDRVIFVPPPDETARKAIFEILLQGKPQEKIELNQVVKKTDGFSGADIKGIIDVSIESVIGESIEKGSPVPLLTRTLLDAVSKGRATTREWFSTAKNYALFANEAGLYDEVLHYLKIKR